jgi:RND family efflux transporter MFP subunit
MSAPKNNRNRNLVILAVLVVAIVAAFGLRFQQLGQSEALASIRSVQETEGVPVETVVVTRDDLSRWITLAGTVEGAVQYSVVSQNALQIVSIDVSEGDVVQAGDVILRMAAGAPSPMYHSLDRSKASYDNALLNVKRMRNLYAEGAVSQSDLDAAETQLKVSAADLQDAQGTTALIALEGGVISSILVTEGETAPVNKPLVWIVATETVKLRFDAGSSQALALAIGQPAQWSLPDGGVGGNGEVSQLDLMADPQTHLLSGEATFANADGRLVPGLLVSFKVRTVHQPSVLTVPRACLVSSESGRAVWVVTPGRSGLQSGLVPVRTGAQNDDRVEILEGPAEGDLIVSYGMTLLSQGGLVKRVDQAEEN